MDDTSTPATFKAFLKVVIVALSARGC